MDALPIELWQRICFRCDIRTAQSLRLVNHTFSQLAARSVFKVIYVAILQDSLDNFEKISNHPILCQCVRELKLLGGILDHLFSHYYSWQRTIGLREPHDRWIMREKPRDAADDGIDAWTDTPRFILESMAANAQLYRHVLSQKNV